MYNKTNWVNHVVENPNTYSLTPNPDGTYKIEPEPGTVIQQGTNIDAEHLNNMENGIEEAHEELKKKMPTAGGTFTGAVTIQGKVTANGMSAGGQKVENVAAPTGNTDAANKAYVDGKHLSITATLSTVWNGSSAPYTQTISAAGILASDNPKIGPVYSANHATALEQKEAWSCVGAAETGNGTITFRCFEDKPLSNIPIVIEVNR